MTPYELPESADLQDKIDRLERMVEALATVVCNNLSMGASSQYDLLQILNELQKVNR
jgi:hypothetical protein